MLRDSIVLFVLASSFAIACKSTHPATVQETATHHKLDADVVQPLNPAQELARKVFVAHGGQSLSKIKRIQLTFDVQNDSESVFSARHDWNLDNQTDQIQWTTPDSTHLDLILNLETNTVEGTANDIPITRGQQDELAADAYRRWVNDTYWLLMPLKLQDPGVHLTLESPQIIDSTTYQVLHMTFEKVGLTPGDQYWVYIDPATYHVARWDMLLEGQDTEPTTVLWENYQKVGPLTLPTRRTWPNSSRQIVFEDTRIVSEN